MKKILSIVFVFVGLLLLSPSLQAQKKSTVSTKKVTVDGKEYYKHFVKSGETLYGLSRAYKVSVDELIRLNPFVEKGLQAGHKLIIPIRVGPNGERITELIPTEKPKDNPAPQEPEKPVVEPVPQEPEKPANDSAEIQKEQVDIQPKVEQEKPVAEEPSKAEPVTINPADKPTIKFNGKDYYLHDVKTGETLEMISEAYQIPADIILQYNPEAKTGLKIGQVLGIPVSLEQEEEVVLLEDEPPVDPTPVQEAPMHEPLIKNVLFLPDGQYVVKPNEDLYDIAKKLGIDIADLKAANPGLKNKPRAGTSITVPNIINDNAYILHHCEKNERVGALLRRWKVDEEEFRKINVSVGSHVFSNQIVLIPIDPVSLRFEPFVEDEEEPETGEVIIDNQEIEEEFDDSKICIAMPENAERRYKVALMVPLYLNDVEDLDISVSGAKKAQKSRPMSFLQFYEGFMMAVEALEKEGLKLDLTVMDVTDNVSSAERALSKIKGKDLDLIVGPFFGKSFALIEEYAKVHDIVVVNPLSTRKSVVENNPNVVKVKPNEVGQIVTISNLVKNLYNDSNVFIVSMENKSDSAFLEQLEHHLNFAVNDEVSVSGSEFLQFARYESERLEMGNRLVNTIDVEGQVYSTNDFRDGNREEVVLPNQVKRYSFDDINKLTAKLSGVRNNLIVAYGDDNVFATQILNALAKETDRFPITLVCAPSWAKFEKLLVDNLLKMNAIYLDDFFVDYKSDVAKHFVRQFRKKYAAEPQAYAFQGYDMAMFFLSAMMRYGDDMLDCLNCCDVPLLHSHYRFFNRNQLEAGRLNGHENLYWNAYQYDGNSIELKPIDPFKKTTE